jgi:choline dehydrogenase-like flavoprotein
VIFDTPRLPLPLRLQADLCVVGAGAGGMMVAMMAAEAGMRVVVLEAGELLTPADMSQREEQMFPRLYWEAGGRATSDRGVRVHQGRGVGGSTLHNLGLCKRIPNSILERWQRDGQLDHLPIERWHALYQEVERLLGVVEVSPSRRNRHNRVLEDGCRALGWRGGGLKHNRGGCVASGFCEIGCSYDGKNNAAKVLLPRAIRAGADVLSCCHAVRVRHDDGRVTGVDALTFDPRSGEELGRVHIDAAQVCVSASATATPALLARSHVPDPSGTSGESLRLHPAVVVAGDFAEPIEAWKGIPQTYECTEFLDLDREDGEQVWIVPAFAHPVGTATAMPGHGPAHRDMMERYAHLAVLTAMVHDETKGMVSPRGAHGLRIDYWPNAHDRRSLSLGLWACAKLLRAAGARRVMVPTAAPLSYSKTDSLDELRQLELTQGQVDITSVHPMASMAMDDDPARSAVDSRGKHHGLDGLWVADGSLFPTSIGVPPQLSIYALGMHVGHAISQSG